MMDLHGRWITMNIPPRLFFLVTYFPRRCLSYFIALFFLLGSGCSTGKLVGIPSSGQANLPESEMTEARHWDAVWRALQQKPQAVAIEDHWRVCGIKYRFRVYGDLLNCLDLLERRTNLTSRQQRYAPVIVGWMRANAYAELGDRAEALKWAESGWAALPQQYRDASAVSDSRSDDIWTAGMGSFTMPVALIAKAVRRFEGDDDFALVAIEAGGARWSEDPTGLMFVGLENPAGLDLRPQSIAMNLAATRALLHQQAGDSRAARVALNELDKWDDAWLILLRRNQFKATATALSLGPLFSMNEYKQVIDRYEKIVGKLRYLEAGRRVAPLVTLGISLLITTIEEIGISDARLFAVSIENASRALLYATSLSRIGELEQAREAFDAILSAPGIQNIGNIYWTALYERGLLSLKSGNRDEGIRFLLQAAAAIDQVRGSIIYEAGKIGFAANTQDVYGALVHAQFDKGDWTGAFLTTERAKSRTLVDLLAQIRDLPPAPDVNERVRILLASAEPNERDHGLLGRVRGADLTAARSQLASVAPEAASLLSVQAVPLEAIAARLVPSETLIAYYISGDQLYAFVIIGSQVEGFELNANGLDAEVRAYREALQNDDSTAVTASAGRALYDRLIRPLVGRLGSGSLTISPHLVLHYLPFVALSDGQQYLVDHHGIRMIPSASALTYLSSDRRMKQGKVLALGNPDLDDPRFDLPGAQREAVAVARLFPASRALLRHDASKTALNEFGPGFSILHIASHGIFDSDAPLTSGLLLARGGGTDGRLTVADLYKSRFDTDLVTLSACETALGKVAGGDDVIGLTRGFFHAGAQTVIASLWRVNDESTEKLMVSFYKNLIKYDKRESLRRAEIEARKSFPDPKYWAAFELSGNAQ